MAAVRRCIGATAGLVLVVSVCVGLAMLLYPYWRCGWDVDSPKNATVRMVLLADSHLAAKPTRTAPLLERLDSQFNDWYYHYIVTTLYQVLKPTHVVMLGDLLSSEHIPAKEFQRRWLRYKEIFHPNPPTLYRMVNIVGNHDIGYAAQADESHIARFEAGFGDVNTNFQVGRHLFVVLNSINLDPSRSRVARSTVQYLYDLTWKHVEEMAKLRDESKNLLTVVLLTHIPLYKPEGICADPPTLEFNRFGQVQQQNVLSPNVTHLLLDKLRPQFIFTGHDHLGCEYRHALPGGGEAREITVRSVQAEYGGHAQLFAIGQKPRPGEARRSRYGLSTCAFHTHIELKVVAGAAAGSLAFLVLWETLSMLYDGLVAVIRRLRRRRVPEATTKLKTT